MSKLLWLDLEMTGLDPVKDEIIELAAIVTEGNDFEVVDQLEMTVKFSDQAEQRMKSAMLADWSDGTNKPSEVSVFDLHKGSGLIERISADGVDSELAQTQFVEFVKASFGDEKAVIAGNSIHQDRRFIRSHWPKLETLLHYRMLDVTSFKLALIGRGASEFKKQDQHRALNDVQESIAELTHYLSYFKDLTK